MDIHDLSNDQLVGVIQAGDRQGLALDRRMLGDDQMLRDLMDDLGISQLAANMEMVKGLVMREALARGIPIPRLN